MVLLFSRSNLGGGVKTCNDIQILLFYLCRFPSWLVRNLILEEFQDYIGLPCS